MFITRTQLLDDMTTMLVQAADEIQHVGLEQQWILKVVCLIDT